jgi:hypothetical protein
MTTIIEYILNYPSSKKIAKKAASAIPNLPLAGRALDRQLLRLPGAVTPNSGEADRFR